MSKVIFQIVSSVQNKIFVYITNKSLNTQSVFDSPLPLIILYRNVLIGITPTYFYDQQS